MKRFNLLAALLACICLVGCPGDDGTTYSETDPAEPRDEHAGHVHGPHDGEVAELTGGEYHVEVKINEDDETVSFYILDKTGKKQVAIDAKEIKVMIKEGDEDEEFMIAAKPEEGEEEGKSSRFFSDDDHLVHDLEEEENGVSVVVTIDGKELTGAVEMHHEGHDHGNEEEKDKDGEENKDGENNDE